MTTTDHETPSVHSESRTLLFIGYLLGALIRPEYRQWLVAICADQPEDGHSVGLYVQRLRDYLTTVLVHAGLEPPAESLGEREPLNQEEK